MLIDIILHSATDAKNPTMLLWPEICRLLITVLQEQLAVPIVNDNLIFDIFQNRKVLRFILEYLL